MSNSVDAPLTEPRSRPVRSRSRSAVGLVRRVGLGTSFATTVLLVIVLACIAAPALAPRDPSYIDADHILSPIGSSGHLLGTDELGRDVLSRLLWGGRVSLIAGVVPAVAAGVLGLIIGLAVASAGGIADRLVRVLADVLLAFPYLLLAVLTVAVLGPSLTNAMIAVVVTVVPARTLLYRSESLKIISGRPYVEAARLLGFSRADVLIREVLPNVLPTAIAILSIDTAFMITATAGLSFLGLGTQPPTADWGTMISSGKNLLFVHPSLTIIPSAVLAVVGVCFAVIGDRLQKVLAGQW